MSLLVLEPFGNVTTATWMEESRKATRGLGDVTVTSPSRYTGFTRGILMGAGSGYICFPIEGFTSPLYFGYGMYLDQEVLGLNNAHQWNLGQVGYLAEDAIEAVEGLIPIITVSGAVHLLQRDGTTTATVLAASTVEPIKSGCWHWVEGYIEFTKSDGGATRTIIKIDGVTHIDATGTVYAPAAHTTHPKYITPYSCFIIYTPVPMTMNTPCITDLYICDSAGSAPFNTWLGELTIESLRPNGDSATYHEWTCSSGSNHYALVDEVPPNDDTDYVKASAGSGLRDLYTFPDLANATGTVKGVQLTAFGRQENPNESYIQNFIARRAGTDANVSGLAVKANSFTSHTVLAGRAIMELDPTDNSTWDITKVNASEFGPRRA